MKEKTISDATEIQRIMRNEEQFYHNKLENLEGMDKFLEPRLYNLPRLTNEQKIWKDKLQVKRWNQ